MILLSLDTCLILDNKENAGMDVIVAILVYDSLFLLF